MVVSFPMTCVATIVRASHWVDLARHDGASSGQGNRRHLHEQGKDAHRLRSGRGLHVENDLANLAAIRR